MQASYYQYHCFLDFIEPLLTTSGDELKKYIKFGDYAYCKIPEDLVEKMTIMGLSFFFDTAGHINRYIKIIRIADANGYEDHMRDLNKVILPQDRCSIFLTCNGGHWVTYVFVPYITKDKKPAFQILYRNSQGQGYHLVGFEWIKIICSNNKDVDFSRGVEDISCIQQVKQNCGIASAMNSMSISIYDAYIRKYGLEFSQEEFQKFDISFCQLNSETETEYTDRVHSIIYSFLNLIFLDLFNLPIHRFQEVIDNNLRKPSNIYKVETAQLRSETFNYIFEKHPFIPAENDDFEQFFYGRLKIQNNKNNKELYQILFQSLQQYDTQHTTEVISQESKAQIMFILSSEQNKEEYNTAFQTQDQNIQFFILLEIAKIIYIIRLMYQQMNQNEKLSIAEFIKYGRNLMSDKQSYNLYSLYFFLSTHDRGLFDEYYHLGPNEQLQWAQYKTTFPWCNNWQFQQKILEFREDSDTPKSWIFRENINHSMQIWLKTRTELLHQINQALQINYPDRIRLVLLRLERIVIFTTASMQSIEQVAKDIERCEHLFNYIKININNIEKIQAKADKLYNNPELWEGRYKEYHRSAVTLHHFRPDRYIKPILQLENIISAAGQSIGTGIIGGSRANNQRQVNNRQQPNNRQQVHNLRQPNNNRQPVNNRHLPLSGSYVLYNNKSSKEQGIEKELQRMRIKDEDITRVLILMNCADVNAAKRNEVREILNVSYIGLYRKQLGYIVLASLGMTAFICIGILLASQLSKSSVSLCFENFQYSFQSMIIGTEDANAYFNALAPIFIAVIGTILCSIVAYRIDVFKPSIRVECYIKIQSMMDEHSQNKKTN